jgi:hypothetical protein
MPIEEAVERGFLPENLPVWTLTSSSWQPKQCWAGLFLCSQEFLFDVQSTWKLLDTVKTEPITQDEIDEWREEYERLEKTDLIKRMILLEELGFEIESHNPYEYTSNYG